MRSAREKKPISTRAASMVIPIFMAPAAMRAGLICPAGLMGCDFERGGLDRCRRLGEGAGGGAEQCGRQGYPAAQVTSWFCKLFEYSCDMVDFEGATHALPLLAGSHHEVLDEELATSVEQIVKRNLALRCVEDVLFP